jgi:hypothetical protein
MAQQLLVGQGFIFKASWSHSDTPHLEGFLWKSDQLIAETLPDNTQHSQQTDLHALAGFEPTISAGLCLRPRSHWDWQWRTCGVNKENVPVPTATYCLGWKCGNRLQKMNLIFTFLLHKVFPFKLFFFISQFRTFFGRKHCIKPLKVALNA